MMEEDNAAWSMQAEMFSSISKKISEEEKATYVKVTPF